MDKKIDICYLCGENLIDEINYDHVPPRQFYGCSVRKTNKLNLLTLPVHKKCNKLYQKDEDYFVHSIAPLAMESYSGNAVWKDILKRRKRIAGQKLDQMVYKEFDPNPSGIVLPNGKVVKRIDGKRVWRVVWKITRGLFFKETRRVLPEDILHNFKIYSVGERPSEEFAYVRDSQSRGQYPGVFDYKYINVPNLNNFHLWAFLFWDKLIMQVGFHDPDCKCNRCQKDVDLKTS
jgi:hypothetical protein